MLEPSVADLATEMNVVQKMQLSQSGVAGEPSRNQVSVLCSNRQWQLQGAIPLTPRFSGVIPNCRCHKTVSTVFPYGFTRRQERKTVKTVWIVGARAATPLTRGVNEIDRENSARDNARDYDNA